MVFLEGEGILDLKRRRTNHPMPLAIPDGTRVICPEPVPVDPDGEKRL
jgi:hypothetical protein